MGTERRYLVTGGAGFIGSNFIRYLLESEPDARVTNLDALTYAGVMATVEELGASSRLTFVHGDIRDLILVDRLMNDHEIVVHFAAESHVDRSISDPSVFLETNVVGTGLLLDAARRANVSRFIHVSTDEVYGSLDQGYAAENAPLRPSSPYSSSKAAADLVALSYANTFDFPVTVTRSTNNYGPYQFPEKLIPLFITNLIEGKTAPVYGDGSNRRDWLFVNDHCAAIHLLVDEGGQGEVYNIGAGSELSNLEVARSIIASLGQDETRIEFVEDRAGHDFRYGVDSSRIRNLGWAPSGTFDDRLTETISWYHSRQDWWVPIKTLQP
jgi:dTDP-glucose 4,6-dehydratase